MSPTKSNAANQQPAEAMEERIKQLGIAGANAAASIMLALGRASRGQKEHETLAQLAAIEKQDSTIGGVDELVKVVHKLGPKYLTLMPPGSRACATKLFRAEFGRMPTESETSQLDNFAQESLRAATKNRKDAMKTSLMEACHLTGRRTKSKLDVQAARTRKMYDDAKRIHSFTKYESEALKAQVETCLDDIKESMTKLEAYELPITPKELANGADLTDEDGTAVVQYVETCRRDFKKNMDEWFAVSNQLLTYLEIQLAAHRKSVDSKA